MSRHRTGSKTLTWLAAICLVAAAAIVATVAPASAAAPNPLSLTRVSGPGSGGFSAAIVGTGLTGATSVTFGGTSATITSNSATKIRVNVPAHLAGVVDVEVTTPGGTGSLTNAFTYLGPTITRLSPTHGHPLGTSWVTIIGTNLKGVSSVTFGGRAVLGMNQAEYRTRTKFKVWEPGHEDGSVGSVDVTVTTPGGTATLTDGYTYELPEITSVTPASGPTSGGTRIVIRGTRGLANGVGGPMFIGPNSVNRLYPAGARDKVILRTKTPAENPNLAGGPYDIVLHTQWGDMTAQNAFTFTEG